jgi:hypothetical protein
MYKASAGAPAAEGVAQGAATGTTGEKKEDVIDAEYVDVDESKRPN